MHIFHGFLFVVNDNICVWWFSVHWIFSYLEKYTLHYFLFCDSNSIYIRTVSSELLFSFGMFDSFLAGPVKCMFDVALPNLPIKQFKPVQQSRQKGLITYCPNIYCGDSTALHRQKLWCVTLAQYLRNVKVKSQKNPGKHGVECLRRLFSTDLLIKSSNVCFLWIWDLGWFWPV